MITGRAGPGGSTAFRGRQLSRRPGIVLLALAALAGGPGTGAVRELHHLLAGQGHDSGACQLCQNMALGGTAVLQAGDRPGGPSDPTLHSPLIGAQTCVLSSVPGALLPRAPPAV